MRRALREAFAVLAAVVLACCLTLTVLPQRAWAATGSGDSVYLLNGTLGWAERTTTGPTTPSTIVGVSGYWNNTFFQFLLGGVALTGTTSFDAASFSAGSLEKHLTQSAYATQPAVLNLTSGSTFTSTSGNLLIENMTVHLSGGSSLSTATGTITLKNCTVVMDDTSSISVSGTGKIVCDGCTIQGGSINMPTGATLLSESGYTNTISDTSITMNTSAIKNSGTLNLSGMTVNCNNATRSAAAIEAVAGTVNIADTTIQNCNNTNASAVPGGAVCVRSGAVVNFGINGASDTSSITNCFAAAANTFGDYGGAAAFVASGATFNMEGGTVSACGTVSAPAQYQTGAFAVVGTFNMSDGTITNCKGSHGGAISLARSGAVANISGGTISNNTCYYDGGGIYVNNNARLTVSGGTISGNTAGRNGAAIGHRGSSTIAISGGTITGNNTTGAVSSSTIGAISGFTTNNYGTVTISGSPTISGNTYAGTTKADLAVYSTNSLMVAGMAQDASVGICSPTATYTASGAQFATSTSTATNVNERVFFNDANAALTGVSGGGTIIEWAPTAKYKIVGPNGPTAYGSLADALVDANAATTDTTIQMLVGSDTLTAQCSVANVNGRTITLTTAKATDTDGYPYLGAASPGKILRGADYGSMFSLTKGGFTLKDITIDGAKASYSSNASGGIVSAAAGCSIALGSGATIQNSKATANGGAFNLAGSGATMTMAPDSAIKDCLTTATYGGAIFQTSGTTFEATGGSITGCSCPGTNASGGAIMQGADYTNMTTILGGTFVGSGNSAYANGTFIHGGGAGSVIIVKDSAQITGNTKIGNSYEGAAIFPYSATVKVQGSPTVSGNTQLDGSAMNVIVKSTSQLVVTGDITGGTVGIWGTAGYYEKTKQFGITTAASAASVAGLSHFSNDRNPVSGLTLMGQPGSGNAVVWGQAVCKIVRGGVATPYSSLVDAVADAHDGETVQMLVPSYTMSATVPLSTAKAVTITTAKITDTDGYPYTGIGGTSAVLLRSPSFTGSFFSASDGGLTFTDIVLDGNAAAGASAATAGGFVSTSGAANVTMADGSVMRNAASSASGTCIDSASGSTGTVTMQGDATIQNCANSSAGGGAAVCLHAGGRFDMTGGSITGCSSTGGGGSVVSLLETAATFNMSGGSITGTDAGSTAPSSNAVVSIADSATNAVHLSGTAPITGNSNEAIAMQGASKVSVADSVNVSDNKRGSTTANIVMTAAGSAIDITAPLTASASVGVTVAATDHVDGHVFAIATSEVSAAASFGRFSDDRSPALAITYDGSNVKFQDFAYLTIAKTFDALAADNASPSALFKISGTVSGVPFTYYQQVGTPNGAGSCVVKVPCGTYRIEEIDGGWRYAASGTAAFTGTFTSATATTLSGCNLQTKDAHETASFTNALTTSRWLSGHAQVTNTLH